MSGLASRIPIGASGYFELDVATFKEIPNDPGLVSSMQSAIEATAAHASALANEVYTTSTKKGAFRTYVEARGQEPPSGPGDDNGYWRGYWARALWSSRPKITDTGSR